MSRMQNSLRLVPAEQDDVGKLVGGDEIGIAQPLAIFLEADAHLGVDVRLDEARRDVDHADVVRGLAFLERRAERAHGRLGGVIHLAVGPRGAIADRADVDDGAALARDHAAQDSADAVEHAFEEDVDLVGHVGDVALLQRPDLEEAGAVDEAFGRTIDRLGLADRAFEGRIVGDVDRGLANPLGGQAVERFRRDGQRAEADALAPRIWWPPPCRCRDLRR